MKKIVPLLVVGFLVLSGLGAVAITEDDVSDSLLRESIVFSEPIIKDEGTYVSVQLAEQTSYLLETNEPVMPVYTKVFTFPRGTKISRVDVAFSEVQTTVLTKPIQPAPAPVPLLEGVTVPEIQMDSTVYASAMLYPADQWSYELKAGLHNGEQSVYVIVRCHPVRYSPLENTLYWSDQVDITVDYVQPTTTITFGDTKDLVIIAPAEFESALQPLVDHKNSFGIVTELKTLEEIYDEYEGRDDPEDIKLYIYDMKETYDITYAMLVGGRKGQTFQWILPERRTNNNDGWESGYSSDLYFADIYKIEENETVFEDWDSNGNDVFAEWSQMVGGKDIMDFVPDVYVGRLACRKVKDVKPVVDKIIAYETETSPEDDWFKKVVAIAGDTFAPYDGGAPGYYEGEMETGVTIDLLEAIGFEGIKLWTSLETLTGNNDVISTFRPGAGFVHFAGHGNPSSWSTHPPDDEEHVWVNGLTIFDIWKLRNSGKLPVVVIGGCHNAQFNVTFAYFIKGILDEGLDFFKLHYYYKEWVPKDMCWWLASQKNGGTIGSMGMTGLGYGYINQHALMGLGGWIEPRFFDAYANQSKYMLGEAHSQAITDYITSAMLTLIRLIGKP
jgi:hypothetical protein